MCRYSAISRAIQRVKMWRGQLLGSKTFILMAGLSPAKVNITIQLFLVNVIGQKNIIFSYYRNCITFTKGKTLSSDEIVAQALSIISRAREQYRSHGREISELICFQYHSNISLLCKQWIILSTKLVYSLLIINFIEYKIDRNRDSYLSYRAGDVTMVMSLLFAILFDSSFRKFDFISIIKLLQDWCRVSQWLLGNVPLFVYRACVSLQKSRILVIIIKTSWECLLYCQHFSSSCTCSIWCVVSWLVLFSL